MHNGSSALCPTLTHHLSYQVGALVQVNGLVNATQHNGKIGVVRGYDEETARYIVQLQGGASMKIKPENLKAA